MSEIIHNGNHERPDAVNDDGDVVPIDDVFSDLETDDTSDEALYLQEALEERDALFNRTSTVPSEVIGVLQDAAEKENGLRALGYTPESIDIKVRKEVKPGYLLAKLASHGIDISGAYPPESENTQDRADVVRMEDVEDDRREQRIDALMNGSGYSRSEAERMVDN